FSILGFYRRSLGLWLHLSPNAIQRVVVRVSRRAPGTLRTALRRLDVIIGRRQAKGALEAQLGTDIRAGTSLTADASGIWLHENAKASAVCAVLFDYRPTRVTGGAEGTKETGRRGGRPRE